MVVGRSTVNSTERLNVYHLHPPPIAIQGAGLQSKIIHGVGAEVNLRLGGYVQQAIYM
jgi:hypothetical protein